MTDTERILLLLLDAAADALAKCMKALDDAGLERTDRGGELSVYGQGQYIHPPLLEFEGFVEMLERLADT